MSLSVVLATYNEADNLKRCLDSVQDLATEIIIVDGGSADSTLKIAKSFGAKIISTTNPPIFHINKQKALEAAKYPWILQLDADEVVSPGLAAEIRLVLSGQWAGVEDESKQRLFARHQHLLGFDESVSNNLNNISAFFIPRLNMFLGKPLRYGGVFPDGVIRLVKKGQAHFPCVSVHEQIQIDGQVSWLANELLHFDSPTLKRYLVRANRYTSLKAAELNNQKIKFSLVNFVNYLVFKPLITFFNLFIRHKGFLDSWRGFLWAFLSSLHHPIAFVKLIKLRLGK